MRFVEARQSRIDEMDRKAEDAKFRDAEEKRAEQEREEEYWREWRARENEKADLRASQRAEEARVEWAKKAAIRASLKRWDKRRAVILCGGI